MICTPKFTRVGHAKFAYINGGPRNLFSLQVGPPNLLRMFRFSLQPTLAETLSSVPYYIRHGKSRSSRQSFDLIGATFQEKLFSHHRAVNEGDPLFIINGDGLQFILFTYQKMGCAISPHAPHAQPS